MLTNKTADELIRIASHGGGFVIDASRFSADNLVRIVSFMKENAFVQIENADRLSADDLVRISSFATGAVVFA